MTITEVTTNKSSSARRKTSSVVYIWPEKETILDNLMNRRDRPYKEWAKLLPEVFKQAFGIEDFKKEYTARWDQYAGCSCPCSPGFVIRAKDKSKPRLDDVHVKVSV